MNSNSSLKQTAFATLLSMILVFMFLACDDGGNQASVSGNDPNGKLPSAVNVGLECEVEGYPCSLAEVPDEILERSQFLADEALAMIENGASMDEVRDWLSQQNGMVEIISDDLALRFRLEGGRGTWILRKEALADPGPGKPAPASVVLKAETLIDQAATDSESAGLPTLSNLWASSVVGPDNNSKKALVLSPMYWDFENNDDGTQTVHHIRQFNPSGYIIPGDIDEVFERSYGGWGLFGGFVKFSLSPSGSTLELLNGDKVTAILNRVGSAGG